MLDLNFQFLTLELKVPEESTCSYLTKGHVYKTSFYGEDSALIIGDINSIVHIRFKDCFHINCDWEILNPHVIEQRANK
jgi:hypothetical protein